jgi:hypothetical protein
MKTFFKIFEWSGAVAFLQSLLPSIKLKITIPLLFASGLLGMVTDLMGVKIQTLAAICVALLAELVSGIYASIKRGEHIRSGKFGRFVVKAFVWLLSIFIVNAFCKEFSQDATSLAAPVMVWVRSAFLMTCFLEYMISINENMESITGKKSFFIKLFTDKIKGLIKGSTDDLKQTTDNGQQTTDNTPVVPFSKKLDT